MKQPKTLLGLIVFLGFFLRVIFLGSIPAGFTPDEASQAYSAYSLLKTGKDEWGTDWPITSFRSFLDYKAPLQTYLMIPSIAIFGLNEFAARLPSALFGTVAILAIYLLTKKLFPSENRNLKSETLPLLAALFLAISPWHLQFSRTALEVNLASFLFPLGLFFFLEGLEKPKHFIYTSFLWGLGLYSYHAAKVFIPLFALALVILYRKQIFRFEFRRIVAPIIITLAFCLPLLFGTLFSSAGKRGEDLLITNLSDEQISQINDQIFYSPLQRISSTIPRIFHNRFVYGLSSFTQNYISYYTPSFWFTEGGREITYSVIPGRGLLYFWMLPLIFWALFNILKKPDLKKVLSVLLPWLILAAIPAALTKEGYRPNRAGSFALLWEMLAAYGLWSLLQIGHLRQKYIISSFFVVALSLTLFYFEDYVFNSSVNYPLSMSYGWRDAMNYVRSVEKMYKTVMIAQGNQPQSFVSFYLQIDPKTFQYWSNDWVHLIEKQGNVGYLDQLGKYNLGKFDFETLNWPEDISKTTLYISPPNPLLPKERNILYKVAIPDGEALEIFDFNK